VGRHGKRHGAIENRHAAAVEAYQVPSKRHAGMTIVQIISAGRQETCTPDDQGPSLPARCVARSTRFRHYSWHASGQRNATLGTPSGVTEPQAWGVWAGTPA